MTITALPSAPLITDTPATFNTKAFALVAALQQFVNEANADASITSLGAGTLTGTLLCLQTGLRVKGNTSNALILKPNETYTANRTLNLVLGDADRTLTIGGASSIDQDVRVAASPQFAAARIANLGIGQASSGTVGIVLSALAGTVGMQCAQLDTTATQELANWLHKATTGNNVWHNFKSDGTDTLRGAITYNRGGGLVAYGTTSDYRAKDIQGLFSGSGTLIDTIQVHSGIMKGATIVRPMFIAHEVVEGGATWAVSGEKDAVDEKGNPIYQQLNEIALIPTMWAEIKSLRSRMSAQEAKGLSYANK